MEIKNKEDRRRTTRQFCLVFFLLLTVMFAAGAVTLVTAQKGAALLEEKKAAYERTIQKQAEINFQLEHIFKDLHNLRTQPRTINEYKQMQKIITEQRMMMEQEIVSLSPEEQERYVIFSQILEVVKKTQETLDASDAESRKRVYNIDQLEKCRQKYQKQTRLKNEKNPTRPGVDEFSFHPAANLFYSRSVYMLV